MSDTSPSSDSTPPSLFDQPVDPIGAYRSDDPPTSKAAARDNLPHRNSQRHRILEALAAAGEHGATDYELHLAAHVRLRNVAAKRRGELVDDGWVARAGSRTRPTDTDSAAQVWLITPAGRQALAHITEEENLDRPPADDRTADDVDPGF